MRGTARDLLLLAWYRQCQTMLTDAEEDEREDSVILPRGPIRRRDSRRLTLCSNVGPKILSLKDSSRPPRHGDQFSAAARPRHINHHISSQSFYSNSSNSTSSHGRPGCTL